MFRPGLRATGMFFTPNVMFEGPEMERALQSAVDVDLAQLYFMTSAVTTLFDVPNCRITRCGYTGEDGVEVVLCNTPMSHFSVD